ncbi:uncharacterized protein RAG0_17609 [Rhynchosporium agropyri]|uniref:Uncharacterized protein n=1 Tax=Rhynchosporium agropyri TaxID=914238 RepID=A0A1E1LU23_9HELO|nr:uncharacterized protein RAG0_17609 [Rhynchosporium agropyri]
MWNAICKLSVLVLFTNSFDLNYVLTSITIKSGSLRYISKKTSILEVPLSYTRDRPIIVNLLAFLLRGIRIGSKVDVNLSPVETGFYNTEFDIYSTGRYLYYSSIDYNSLES